MKDKTLEKLRGINRHDIIKGMIIEMNNYGYHELYMGKIIIQVINILDSEENKDE